MNKRITIKNLLLLKEAWKNNSFEPSMAKFGGIADRHESKAAIDSVNECGTNCCILGYAPNVKGLEIAKSDFSSIGFFKYYTYSLRNFPYIGQNYENHNNAWDFLFSEEWKDSKEMFFERLDYLIKNNLFYLRDVAFYNLKYSRFRNHLHNK